MKARQIVGWIFTAVFAGIGALILWLTYSHQFISYTFFGIAAIIALFLLLQLLGCRLKRTAKVLRLLLSVMLGLGILAAAVTGFQISAASNGTSDEPCDYLIVLGCAVNDSEPSQMLSYRINAAYEYLKENPQTKCIVTGGLGKDDSITEAQCMFNELTARGIEPERIYLEEKATSTFENLTNSKAILQEITGGESATVGVLSSEFHLYRAQMVAEDLGMDVQTVPAVTERTDLLCNYSIREILSVWKYKVLER